MNKLITDTIRWIQENSHPIFVTPETYAFFHAPCKEEVVVLVFFSKEEELFYQKLQIAIQQHLCKARVVDGEKWEKEKQAFTPKWILATREIPGEKLVPMIHLSSPSFYQDQLEAKKKLWKMLCQTLTLPQSS